MTALDKEHRWGNEDESGARACTRRGCTVRVADAFRWWQSKKGGHWRRQDKELIPPCGKREATK